MPFRGEVSARELGVPPNFGDAGRLGARRVSFARMCFHSFATVEGLLATEIVAPVYPNFVELIGGGAKSSGLLSCMKRHILARWAEHQAGNVES